MMDIGNITALISSVGFPIAACIALFYFMMTMLKEHKEEINALRASLEANTLAITELKGLLENVGSKD